MDVIDSSELTDTAFANALELRRSLDAQRDAEITPTGADELRLQFTVDETENAVHERSVAFDHGRAVAIGHLELTRDPANPDQTWIEIDALESDLPQTDPLLTALLDRAEADGRSSILVWGDLTDAADAHWTGHGATRRMVERESDLLLADVDVDLMARWVDARRERAASVELVTFVGLPPDEHLDAFVVARNAMNDAPRDDLEMQDFILTAADTRADARAWSALGWDVHGLLAIENDGSAAAVTTVLVNTHRPDASWQGDTVVLEKHRRRGIGRWIKAAMFFHLRQNQPQLTRLRTGNAESNDPMLAINVAMGFEPAHTCAAWQTDLATFRASLD